MKIFLFKSLALIIPIGVLFAFPFSVMILAREFSVIENVIETQQRTEGMLVNFAYGNYTKRYKIFSTIQLNPDVVVLGTSRVMQFRGAFFKEPGVFYNAGGMDNASDLAPFLNDTSIAKNLRIVLVGIDARYLQEKQAVSVSSKKVMLTEQLHRFLTLNWRMVYKDYLSGKFSMRDLYRSYKDSSHIGLTALVKERGFRKDGSFDYGDEILSNPKRVAELDYSILERLDDIDAGGRGIGYDSIISNKHLSDIEDFLLLAKERGIHVIGFLPPSPTLLNQKTQFLSDARGETFRTLPIVLTSLFSKYQYHFYDTSSLSTIGSSEKEMIDIEHTGEKATLRLLLYLMKQEPLLGAYGSQKTLEPLLLGESDVEVF